MSKLKYKNLNVISSAGCTNYSLHGGFPLPVHDSALLILNETGHRNTVEYILTIEAHNQLLQYELERILVLLSKQSAEHRLSGIAEQAEAVLKYTRAYSNRQH